MKKSAFIITVALALATLFHACSTNVDLYAEYKDISIVYGLLDPAIDTNYIKINRAFLGPGNSLITAKNPDSSNYPGKLDVRILEYSAGKNTPDHTYILDTITIHNKVSGVFYAPHQKLYYTTADIKTGKTYELLIFKGNDTIKATTTIVGGTPFEIVSKNVDVSMSTQKGKLRWRESNHAGIYGLVLEFNYHEKLPGQDSTIQHLAWKLGSFPASQLKYENNAYTLTLSNKAFWNELALKLGSDSLVGVRYLDTYPITVHITAGGDELHNYMEVNAPSSSIVQSIPEYTNLSGGAYGIFSSRTTLSGDLKMSPLAIYELFKRNWGFVQH